MTPTRGEGALNKTYLDVRGTGTTPTARYRSQWRNRPKGPHQVADSVLAGLPRLVRVRDEVRMRGIAALGIGAATVGWWMLAWLLDEGVDGLRFLAAVAVIGIPSLIAAWLLSRRRVGAAVDFQAPPRNAVYETIAAARERRTRLAGVVLFAVIILMIFDHFSHGAGEMAGL